MKKANPMFLVGLIFALFGLGFAVLGGVFVAVSHELLPRVFTPEVWMGDTPDELALPMVGLVFTPIGLIFAVIGVILLLVGRRQGRLREELLRFGVREKGVVTDIRIDRSYRVNGRSPLRIMVEAKHPFTGETKTLRAPLVWDATLSMGDAVEVLFDPQDEKKYYVLLPGDGE